MGSQELVRCLDRPLHQHMYACALPLQSSAQSKNYRSDWSRTRLSIYELAKTFHQLILPSNFYCQYLVVELRPVFWKVISPTKCLSSLRYMKNISKDTEWRRGYIGYWNGGGPPPNTVRKLMASDIMLLTLYACYIHVCTYSIVSNIHSAYLKDLPTNKSYLKFIQSCSSHCIIL